MVSTCARSEIHSQSKCQSCATRSHKILKQDLDYILEAKAKAGCVFGVIENKPYTKMIHWSAKMKLGHEGIKKCVLTENATVIIMLTVQQTLEPMKINKEKKAKLSRVRESRQMQTATKIDMFAASPVKMLYLRLSVSVIRAYRRSK